MTASPYLILIPISGLALAAAFFFIFGGIGLVKLPAEVVIQGFGLFGHEIVKMDRGEIIFEVVEYVRTFLVGTVLYITAIGLTNSSCEKSNSRDGCKSTAPRNWKPA